MKDKIMFIRTENGIYEVVEEIESAIDNKVVGYDCYFNDWDDEQRVDFVPMVDVIKESEKLEELIKGGDLIIVIDSKDNKYPIIFVNRNYFESWCRTHDNLISKMEWYIKVGNNYKLVATKQDKGEWELL